MSVRAGTSILIAPLFSFCVAAFVERKMTSASTDILNCSMIFSMIFIGLSSVLCGIRIVVMLSSVIFVKRFSATLLIDDRWQKAYRSLFNLLVHLVSWCFQNYFQDLHYFLWGQIFQCLVSNIFYSWGFSIACFLFDGKVFKVHLFFWWWYGFDIFENCIYLCVSAFTL